MTHVREYHNGKLLIGDVLDRIKDIPDNSVDVAASSPPYYNLRDYGIAGQIGLEANFKDYLAVMQKVMDEIKRILKPTGTCWINLGDSYSTQSGGMRDLADGKTDQTGQIDYGSFDGAQNIRQAKTPFKPKTRIGIPERFYIECIDKGWIARNHIVWAKSNAMPTSVKDRFQNKWESIFFFAKNTRYFFNLDAVREKPQSEYKDFNRRVRDSKKFKAMGLGDFSPSLAKATDKELAETDKNGAKLNSETASLQFGKTKRYDDWRDNFEEKWQEEKDNKYGNDDKGARRSRVSAGLNQKKGNHQPQGRSNFGTGNDIRNNMEKASFKKYNTPANAPEGSHKIQERMAQSRAEGANHDGCLNNPAGKNPGDIFFINPKPFVEAHFATFPLELPMKIVKCSVPEKVCKDCGKPVENIMEPTTEYKKFLGNSWHDHENDLEQGMQQKMEKASVTASYVKVGEKTCDCKAGFEPGVIFDPFMGAGTVALAAISLNRRWLGIELNPEYADIIDKRLKPKMNYSLDSFGDPQ